MGWRTAAGGGHGGKTVSVAEGDTAGACAADVSVEADLGAGDFASVAGASSPGFDGFDDFLTSGRRCSISANCLRYSERFSRQAT